LTKTIDFSSSFITPNSTRKYFRITILMYLFYSMEILFMVLVYSKEIVAILIIMEQQRVTVKLEAAYQEICF